MLTAWFATLSPSYNPAGLYLKNNECDQALISLMSQDQEATMTPRRAANEWPDSRFVQLPEHYSRTGPSRPRAYPVVDRRR